MSPLVWQCISAKLRFLEERIWRQSASAIVAYTWDLRGLDDSSKNKEGEMPARWVIRKDCDGIDIAGPLPCYVANAIVAEKGVRTVEQCIQELLADGEFVRGEGDNLEIVRGDNVVGFVEVIRRST